MLNFIYCSLFEKKISGQSYEKQFRNKLEELSSRKKLSTSGNLKDYTNGLFVLRTYSPNSRIVIEERTIEGCNIYLVRDVITGKDFDDYYGIYIHPKLKSGEWLENNPITENDQVVIREKIEKCKEGNCSIDRQKPPKDVIGWLDEFRLKIEYDIYESEEWVRYALSDSSTEGMDSTNVHTFRLLLVDIINQSDSFNSDKLNEEGEVGVLTAEKNFIGIIYSEIYKQGRKLIILHGGAHVNKQSQYWDKLKSKYKNSKSPITGNLEELSRFSYRAYPKWTVNNDELWFAIEKNSELSNLSLTKEQIDFFESFMFPYYINGQAGSGKSTMLYYLYANACYYKHLEEIKGELIFLTENEKLLENSKKSVLDLLTNNPDFELSIEARNKFVNSFASFKNFLLDIIPEGNREEFCDSNYLNYSVFKDLYENSQIPTHVKTKYTAEESWFTIITYIYGYDPDKKITSEDYETIVHEKSRFIPKETFKGVEEHVLPFYDRLINENGYWDKLKIIRYITETISELPKYSLVVCDEAQDFCRVELKFILQLSEFLDYDLSEVEQVPIVFAGDPNQTVNPTGFREREMTGMLYEELRNTALFRYEKGDSVYNPSFNYRSCYPVVSLANYVQYFRKKNLDIRQASPQEAKRPRGDNDIETNNFFFDIDSLNDNIELKNDLKNKIKYKVFIIPVDVQEKEKYIRDEEFLNVINHLEIKTSVESKGAEYQQVVLYGFGEYFLKNFKTLTNGDEENEKFKKRYFFNKLYVGITRAQRELIIIDSARSESNFWKELITIPEITEPHWSKLNEQQDDVFLFNPGSIKSIIQSTKEVAAENAIKDKEQGIYESNPARLKVAANQFNNLGLYADSIECLALSERIKANWKKAGELFQDSRLEGRLLAEAADCYFQGSFFGELLGFDKRLKDVDQDIRVIVSRVMRAELLKNNEIELLFKYKDNFRNLISKVQWRADFISRIIIDAITEREYDAIKNLADSLVFIAKDYESELWRTIGELYYKIEKYKECIDAWNRIDYLEDPKYIEAQILHANEIDDYESYIVWLGKKANYLSDNIEKGKVENEIINTYLKKGHQISSDRTLFHQSILKAYLIHKPHENIHKLCENFEKTSHVKDMHNVYENILLENRIKGKVLEFIIERWIRAFYEMDKNDTNFIKVLNERVEEYNSLKIFNVRNYSLREVEEIPRIPKEILWEPPLHLKFIEVENFRRIRNIKLSNLGQFNLVVGDNNVGKTSILEALLFNGDKSKFITHLAYAYAERSNVRLPMYSNSLDENTSNICAIEEFIRRGAESMKFIIEERRSSWSFELRKPSNEEIMQSVAMGGEVDPDDYFGMLSDDNEIEPVYLPLILKKLDSQTALKVPFIPFGKGYSKDLAQAYYDEIDKKKAIRNQFLRNMSSFIPNIERINVDTENGLIEVEEENVEEGTSIHQFGEGANKLFRILVQIALNENGRLNIDEIDAGIHYSHFKEFWITILQFAERYNTQIFATTHNLECVLFFKEILDDEDFQKYRELSRVITLRELPESNIRAYTRIYEEFKYELDNEFEIRGGVL